jgi:hypothetical protein
MAKMSDMPSRRALTVIVKLYVLFESGSGDAGTVERPRRRRARREMLKRTNGATLADVAREAGVSLKTASRVLNMTPVAPATARKVQ